MLLPCAYIQITMWNSWCRMQQVSCLSKRPLHCAENMRTCKASIGDHYTLFFALNPESAEFCMYLVPEFGITVSADILAHYGARSSAGTVMSDDWRQQSNNVLYEVSLANDGFKSHSSYSLTTRYYSMINYQRDLAKFWDPCLHIEAWLTIIFITNLQFVHVASKF